MCLNNGTYSVTNVITHYHFRVFSGFMHFLNKQNKINVIKKSSHFHISLTLHFSFQLQLSNLQTRQTHPGRTLKLFPNFLSSSAKISRRRGGTPARGIKRGTTNNRPVFDVSLKMTDWPPTKWQHWHLLQVQQGRVFRETKTREGFKI